MDAEYLKANVGDVLAQALARVAVEKPADPVEFTGHYLLRHVENHLREDKVRTPLASASLRYPGLAGMDSTTAGLGRAPSAGGGAAGSGRAVRFSVVGAWPAARAHTPRGARSSKRKGTRHSKS